MADQPMKLPEEIEYRPGNWTVSHLHPGGKVRRKATVRADNRQEAELLAEWQMRAEGQWTDPRVEAKPDLAPEPADYEYRKVYEDSPWEETEDA